jgi:transcriptional antiterminator RfaH
VATHPQAERHAARNLHDQGYQRYLPLMLVQRYNHAARSMRYTIDAPLFPSYLFVRFDAHRDQWRPIQNTPGVFSLLRCHDTGLPQPCPDAVVDALQATEGARLAITPRNSQWAPGTPCSLATGPFRDHPGVVVSVTRGIAHVALMLFGHVRDVTVNVDCLIPRE